MIEKMSCQWYCRSKKSPLFIVQDKSIGCGTWYDDTSFSSFVSPMVAIQELLDIYIES